MVDQFIRVPGKLPSLEMLLVDIGKLVFPSLEDKYRKLLTTLEMFQGILDACGEGEGDDRG